MVQLIGHDSLKDYCRARAHSDFTLNLSIIETMYLEKVMTLRKPVGTAQPRGRFGCAEAALSVSDSIFYISGFLGFFLRKGFQSLNCLKTHLKKYLRFAQLQKSKTITLFSIYLIDFTYLFQF